MYVKAPNQVGADALVRPGSGSKSSEANESDVTCTPLENRGRCYVIHNARQHSGRN